MSRRGLRDSHGTPRTGGSHTQRRGPLRKIEAVLRYGEGMFDRDFVRLECGHEVHSNAQYKARCSKCAVEGK